MKSPKNSFRGTSYKLLKSLGLSLLGASATWLLTLTDVHDLGTLAPLIGALAPFIANTINEYIKEVKQ